MQPPHSALVPAKYFTQTDSFLRPLSFLSAFQNLLYLSDWPQNQNVSSGQMCSLYVIPRFFFSLHFFFKTEKLHLAFPASAFIMVTDVLPEACLFTSSCLVPREMPFNRPVWISLVLFEHRLQFSRKY